MPRAGAWFRLHGLNNNTSGHRALSPRAERDLVPRPLDMARAALGRTRMTTSDALDERMAGGTPAS